MLIALDIGNTNIVAGCFQGDDLVYEFRLKTDPCRTVDEYKALVLPLLHANIGAKLKIDQAIVSSVVPQLTSKMVRLLEDCFAVQPLVVGPGIKTGLSLKLSNPSAVGSDRVVNALAAKHLYGLPALIIDFGTATSFDYIDQDSNYCGGAIAPGLEGALDELVSHTAQLPRIALVWPKSVIGRDTVSAMQSGGVVGYLCLVEGLIGRMVEEVGPVPHIIATGGLGQLMTDHSSLIKVFDPSLTLQGMRILAKLNF